MHYFCNNLLDQSKRRLINYDNKPDENLVGGGVRGDNCRSLLIDTMAHRQKYSRYITLGDTNTVIRNITNNGNCN